MALYKGYSSFNFQSDGTFQVTDIDCVKMDLLNHFFTRKGTRVMMPNFGTSIPDLVFEPLTDELLETLQEEVMQVVNYDPRVSLQDITVTPYYDENRVEIKLSLFYIELNLIDNMDLHIDFQG